MSERALFNAPGFYSAMDESRASRGASWRQVAKEAGISQSTLTRLAQGKRPDVDSLAALARWANVSVDQFIDHENGIPGIEPLAAISTYLRADRSLSPEAAEALEKVIRATYSAMKAHS
jgi:transcriptional regulator with XRE-family HTH domain